MAILTNHERAVADLARRKRELTLSCPKCGAANRPGAIYVEIDDYDSAYCGVCSHIFRPEA